MTGWCAIVWPPSTASATTSTRLAAGRSSSPGHPSHACGSPACLSSAAHRYLRRTFHPSRRCHVSARIYWAMTLCSSYSAVFRLQRCVPATAMCSGYSSVFRLLLCVQATALCSGYCSVFRLLRCVMFKLCSS